MAESVVSVGMDSEEYRAMRLHALSKGMTVEELLLSLARKDVAARQGTAVRTREETAAAILARAGIDPSGPEHRAAAAAAAAAIRQPGARGAA